MTGSTPPPTPTPRPNDGWSAFVRLLGFWRPYWKHVAASAVLAVIMVVMALLGPAYIGNAVNHFDRDEFDSIPKDAMLLLAAATLSALIGVSRRLVAGSMSLGIEQMLRDRLFAHLSGLGFRFFDKQQTGQLLSRVTSDVSSVRFFLGYGLTYLFVHASRIIAIPIAMFLIDPVLAGIVCASMPLLVVVSVVYSRRSAPILRESQQKLALVTAHGEETIVGARVVRAFGQEQREVDRFRQLTQGVVEQERMAMFVKARYQPLYEFIPSLVLVAVVYFGARRIDSGHIDLGQLTAFSIYVLMFSSPLRIVGNLLGRAQRATASSQRLWELLDADDRIPQIAHPQPLPERRDDGTEIRFEHVSFGYRTNEDGTTRRVLDDVSLTIPAGATVALIGPTGCGKTTLASLVPRFYDPEVEGRVLLDGVDLRELELQQLRRSIGLVDQEPFLFSASVRDNLAYGSPDVSDEEIWAAVDAAQAREFLEQLPDGLDTVVGERGLTLSGGQRQRMAIARALVVDPRVLILDDATASVDSRVEARISDALASATRKRTTIIIAHRPSTIALADLIVVLREGHIDDMGTHDELIARNETYRLVQEQRGPRREFLLDQDAERCKRTVEQDGSPA